MKCSVCKNPERYQIDCALLAGATLKSLAKPHGLSKSALQRHHVHLKEKINSARRALERSFQQDRLVHYARALDRLEGAAQQAQADGDVKLNLQLTREANRTNKLMGDIDFHLDDQAVYQGLTSPTFPEQATVIPLDPHIYAHSRRALAQTFTVPCPPPPRRSRKRPSLDEILDDGIPYEKVLEEVVLDFPFQDPKFRQKYMKIVTRLERRYPDYGGEAQPRDCSSQPDPFDPEDEDDPWDYEPFDPDDEDEPRDCQPEPDPFEPEADFSDLTSPPSLSPVPDAELPASPSAPDPNLPLAGAPAVPPPGPDRDAPGSELGNNWEISGKNSGNDLEMPGKNLENPRAGDQPPPAVMERPAKPNGLFWQDWVFHGIKVAPTGSGPDAPSPEEPAPPDDKPLWEYRRLTID